MTGLRRKIKEVQILFKNNLKIDGNKVKKQLKAIVSNRVIIIGIFVLFLFCLLVYRLFVLQIVEGQEHLDSFNYKVERTIETSGSRGMTATASCWPITSWLTR